jgi:phosphoribosyl-ATP pyrophosphohydrolase/phosphoribosyl-AMP cyclohydrolase
LESVIAQRIADKPEGSYTARIWNEGPSRIAQKVGEEGVEVALAAVTQEDERLVSESADLLFHLTLLLKSRNLSLAFGQALTNHRALNIYSPCCTGTQRRGAGGHLAPHADCGHHGR